MIRYTVGIVADRTAHPLLMGLIILAVIFLLSGVALEFYFARELAAGFMLVYSVMAAALAGLGYAIILVVKLVQRIQRQYDLA